MIATRYYVPGGKDRKRNAKYIMDKYAHIPSSDHLGLIYYTLIVCLLPSCVKNKKRRQEGG